MNVTHHHPCQQCRIKTPCDGTWEENYEGVPSVICRAFHLDGGTVNPNFLCEDCTPAWRKQRRTPR